MPHNHKVDLCTFSSSSPELVSEAIDAALAAKPDWESMPYNDRAAIFLKVSQTPYLRLSHDDLED